MWPHCVVMSLHDIAQQSKQYRICSTRKERTSEIVGNRLVLLSTAVLLSMPICTGSDTVGATKGGPSHVSPPFHATAIRCG